MFSECNAIATIPTKDIEASRRFYEDVLGLPIERDDEMGIWYRCGGTTVYLYETDFAGTAEHTLVSFESAHIDDDIGELRERGVSFETYALEGVEWDGDVANFGGMKGFWFKDPAGNILGMFDNAMVAA